MPSRSNLEQRPKPPVTTRRNTTVGQDVAEIVTRGVRMLTPRAVRGRESDDARDRYLDKEGR